MKKIEIEIEKCMAKSNPQETVRQHTDKLRNAARRLWQLKYIDDETYKLLLIVCEYHDYGKVNEEFQERIKNQSLFDEKKEIPHGILSTVFLNRDMFDNDDDYFIAMACVMLHHRIKNNIIEEYFNDTNLSKKIKEFAQEYTEENCGNCDNCLNPKKQVEAQELLCAVIEAIIAVKENFKADYIIDIIQGRETTEVQAHLHEDLEAFGSGMGEEDKTWNAVIRQALIAGYLSKDVENYGLLKVTDAGKKFLKHPKSFKITEDNDFEEVEEEAPARGGGSCAVDPALYSMLKDLRKKLSKKLDVPPYVIFQDPSLEAMATIYPVTLEELQNIPGVGAGKAKRYGQEFCVLIKKHCEENEIERPEDLRVRTVANKSKLKVSIIQAIDRKVALDDIAVSKGLEFGELLDEVEAIVYSGTKLNIDYFLEEIMDEDHLNDIYDYFKESTTDKIDDAMDELGDDYTEDEIRLVRIKFISEMAN